MVFEHKDDRSEGIIRLITNEPAFSSASFHKENDTLLTIAWNKGKSQDISVDDEVISIKNDEVVVFNANQTFSFDHPEGIVAWQFNREFYCIIDHDEEVSCVGLLFYGHRSIPTILLDTEDKRKLDLLLQVFEDEYDEEADNLKTEMLRVILKRLIVKLTRTYKKQTSLDHLEDGDMNVIRRYNLLVEKNFKKLHQVQDYADLLYKSPKTISNLFSKYSEQSPLEVIHHRIMLEAKRLLLYTDKTAKEIAYELGFQDIPNFSRFYKKNAQQSPSQYRSEYKKKLIGKN